jgi:hypothetical protein
MLVQYTSRREPAQYLLDEAQALGREHGWLCRQAGLSSAQVVEVFLSFRRSLMESLEIPALSFPSNDPEGRRIRQRMGAFLDSLLVAAVEGHSASH